MQTTSAAWSQEINPPAELPAWKSGSKVNTLPCSSVPQNQPALESNTRPHQSMLRACAAPQQRWRKVRADNAKYKQELILCTVLWYMLMPRNAGSIGIVQQTDTNVTWKRTLISAPPADIKRAIRVVQSPQLVPLQPAFEPCKCLCMATRLPAASALSKSHKVEQGHNL